MTRFYEKMLNLSIHWKVRHLNVKEEVEEAILEECGIFVSMWESQEHLDRILNVDA